MEDKILIGIIIIIMSIIIYFNIFAILNYGKSFELNIINTGVKCKYDNLKVASTCPNTDGSLCIPKNNNIYLLGQQPVSFTQVCSTICKPKLGSTSCGNDTLNKKFSTCLNDLKPPKKCTDVAQPLALNQDGNYLYAQQLFSGNS